jgi:hypothetical protein
MSFNIQRRATIVGHGAFVRTCAITDPTAKRSNGPLLLEPINKRCGANRSQNSTKTCASLLAVAMSMMGSMLNVVVPVMAAVIAFAFIHSITDSTPYHGHS